MAAMEAAARLTALGGCVRAHVEGGNVPPPPPGAAAANPDEIDLGDDDGEILLDDDDDDDKPTRDVDVEQSAVPEGVFGGVKRAAEETPGGVMDRFKRARGDAE